MASISTFFKRFFDQKNATVTASVHASLSFNATASATASMTSMLQLVGGVSATVVAIAVVVIVFMLLMCKVFRRTRPSHDSSFHQFISPTRRNQVYENLIESRHIFRKLYFGKYIWNM